MTQRGDLQSAIGNLQSAIEPLAQTYADRRALLTDKVRGLGEEGERIQREIAQLRTGDRNASYEAEAPAAGRLRRLLRAELGLGADAGEAYLKRLAPETGGTCQHAANSAELAQLFRNVADLLKQRYRITYTWDLPADGGTHQV